MDTRTDKLTQQAGKFIQQGKFSHALEQYLKAHQLNPGETTILNMIGDLYVRLGKKTEALLWYHKLADALRSQDLRSNASAAYKKILKLSPEDQDAMNAWQSCMKNKVWVPRRISNTDSLLPRW
jgi:tetratricopeptide (TPR) repeat protein